jgi:hypothetical protein
VCLGLRVGTAIDADMVNSLLNTELVLRNIAREPAHDVTMPIGSVAALSVASEAS